jgi:LPS-assembly protein
MLLSVLFTKTSLLAEGDLSYREIEEELVDDYNLDMVYDSRLAFKMHHFWKSYDDRFTLDYLLVADYYPEDDSRWNLLTQEFHLIYGNYRFSSRLDYSIEHNTFAQFSNSFSYSDETFGLKLEHTRRESSLYENTPRNWDDSLDQNEVSIAARYRSSEMLTWYGGYTYDFKENTSKNWQAGLLVDRKCWNFTVVFEQEVTPVLTNGGGGSIRENKVYFQLNLVPFGGVGSDKKASI